MGRLKSQGALLEGNVGNDMVAYADSKFEMCRACLCSNDSELPDYCSYSFAIHDPEVKPDRKCDYRCTYYTV